MLTVTIKRTAESFSSRIQLILPISGVFLFFQPPDFQQSACFECGVYSIFMGILFWGGVSPCYFRTLTNSRVSQCLFLSLPCSWMCTCATSYMFFPWRMCYYPIDQKQRHRNYLANELLVGCNTDLICSKHTICTL